MYGFDIFRKINAKLDEGWKLTNANCPICNTTILGQPASKDLYCVKCDMPVKMEAEEEEDEVEVINSGSGNGSASKRNEVEEFDNMLFSKEYEAKRKRADELSKKTGELLLKGWAMLEDTCLDCLFPYMKSKAGEVICVGCGPVNKKKEEAPKKPAVSETITSSPEIIKAQDTPKEEIKQTKPVAPKEEKIVEAPVREEAPREKREKPAKAHRSHEKSSNQENISAEVIEKFRFDESINLYSKMTQILSNNLDDLEDQGFPTNLNKLKEILEFQKQIDEAKTKVLLLHTKSKKHHH